MQWRNTLVRGDRFVLRTDFDGKGGYHLDLLGGPWPVRSYVVR